MQVLRSNRLAVRQTQRSQNVIAPSTLNLVSRTAMDGITFVMWYIGNNKYKIQVLSFINQSIAAYISDQNLAGLDVGAWPVAAQGHAFGEISGVNPGDVLTYTWKTNNREGQEVEDFPGFFLLAY